MRRGARRVESAPRSRSGRGSRAPSSAAQTVVSESRATFAKLDERVRVGAAQRRGEDPVERELIERGWRAPARRRLCRRPLNARRSRRLRSSASRSRGRGSRSRKTSTALAAARVRTTISEDPPRQLARSRQFAPPAGALQRGAQSGAGASSRPSSSSCSCQPSLSLSSSSSGAPPAASIRPARSGTKLGLKRAAKTALTASRTESRERSSRTARALCPPPRAQRIGRGRSRRRRGGTRRSTGRRHRL